MSHATGIVVLKFCYDKRMSMLSAMPFVQCVHAVVWICSTNDMF